MLYEKSGKPFSTDDYAFPGPAYRDAPFWAWNTYMTREMIDEQLACFKEMGMGGFFIHVRVGLKNQYLGSEFMDLVRYCADKARELGLLCWLYDEDRYASGIAGGEVTKRVAFRARSLRFSPIWRPELSLDPEVFQKLQQNNEKAAGCLLKTYDIVLEDGYLVSARILGPRGKASGTKWYLYEELAPETPWCNNQTYVDVLNREATDFFIRTTHEKYCKTLSDEFGTLVPAIFTDEPHFTGPRYLSGPEECQDAVLPFTEALPEKFRKLCGRDFFDAVPSMIWRRKGQEISPENYYLYRACSELFAENYCRPIGEWCEKHGIASTGHILSEETLRGQMSTAGDAMRSYQEFQIPGIDNLCDERSFSTVKQASSISSQMGREGTMSELYGVTQWDFGFEGYKLSGDWQAALGITLRVPHLAWASMAGEAKRDYPAAIGWQSPWYRDYRYLSDYFARVNACMTRGKPLVHVGVLHPLESMWLCQGPASQVSGQQEQMEEDFQALTEWLLTGGIDFDYISESMMERDEPEEKGIFCCGAMRYQVIVISDCINLRSSTWNRLKSFVSGGGTVILCGEGPRYVDCKREPELE